MDGCKPPRRYWDLNLCPLEGYSLLMSLHPSPTFAQTFMLVSSCVSLFKNFFSDLCMSAYMYGGKAFAFWCLSICPCYSFFKLAAVISICVCSRPHWEGNELSPHLNGLILPPYPTSLWLLSAAVACPFSMSTSDHSAPGKNKHVWEKSECHSSDTGYLVM